MIKTASIYNFESHKETRMNFHKGVNAFIGESDKGKSSILRALYWVMFNKPSGDSFKSYWDHQDTEVMIHLDDCSIYRGKGGKGQRNEYRLGKEEPFSFRAFGQGVPEEIEKVLNVSSINWQTQFDSHFLLSNSAPEVARKLNDIVNLDIIDSSLTNILSLIRNNKVEIAKEESCIEHFKEELSQFDYLDDLEERIECVEELTNKKEQLKNYIRELEGLKESIEKSKRKLRKLKPMLSIEKKVDELLERIKGVKKLRNRIKKLEELKESIEYKKERIVVYKLKTKQAQEKFNELMPDICPLCNQEIINET